MRCSPSHFRIVLLMLFSLTGCQGAGSRPSLLTQGTGKVPPPATGSYGTPDKGYFNNPGGSGTTGSGFGSGWGSGSGGSGTGTIGSGGTSGGGTSGGGTSGGGTSGGGTGGGGSGGGGSGGVRPGTNGRSSLDRSTNARMAAAGNGTASSAEPSSDWRPVGTTGSPKTPFVSPASYEREESVAERSPSSSRSKLMERLRGMPANDATGNDTGVPRSFPRGRSASDGLPEPESEPSPPASRSNSKLRWGPTGS